MRWLVLPILLFLAACDLGPRPDVPEVTPNYTLDYQIVGLGVDFTEKARLLGLPSNDPAEVAKIRAELEETMLNEFQSRVLPGFQGQKRAILKVDMLVLSLPDQSAAMTGEARDQLLGNIFLFDVDTQQEIQRSGVRIGDFTFKAEGNIGALITLAANNKNSYKRRFDKLARDFAERSALILK